MMAWLCIHVPVPSLFTHVLRLCGANLQRMPSSSFPSFDINIWTNAVRQLLVENPQQSLAVTTWECSSEGHALHCDYKQHRECRAHDATIVLPRRHFWCFCYSTNIQGFFFFRAIVRLHAVASGGICSPILIMISQDSRCFMPFTLYNCSQYFWRLEVPNRFDEGGKNSNNWDCEGGIECSNPTDATKAHTRHSSKWVSLILDTAVTPILFIPKLSI